MGCDHPCASFVFSCGYLGLFLLLAVCSCIYVLFSLFGCGFVFRLFVLVVFGFLFCWCGGFFTHNEDIVTFRCGGGELCLIFEIMFKFFFWVFGSSVLYFICFKPRKLDY